MQSNQARIFFDFIRASESEKSARRALAENWVNTCAVKMFLQLLKKYNLHFKKTYKILSANDSLDEAEGAARA